MRMNFSFDSANPRLGKRKAVIGVLSRSRKRNCLIFIIAKDFEGRRLGSKWLDVGM